MEATDWDKDHVDLKWEPPKNDGGAPVTGYLVEKKDKSGKWVPVLEVRDRTAAMLVRTFLYA